VAAAAFWGFFAAGSLLLGAALALWRPWSARTIGLVMAFGTGVLFSSVAFDLVEDSLDSAGGGPTTAGIAAGAAAYFVGDMLVSRRGAADRKSAVLDDRWTDADEEGNPAAIVVGAVLDGIPESVAIGISLLEGGHIGGVFVAAVFMSNIPEAMSASAGLSKQGRTSRKHLRPVGDRRCRLHAGVPRRLRVARRHQRRHDRLPVLLRRRRGAHHAGVDDGARGRPRGRARQRPGHHRRLPPRGPTGLRGLSAPPVSSYASPSAVVSSAAVASSRTSVR
jgi:hypothetical protein